MKTLTTLFLAACLLAPLVARAGYDTNSFFVTLEPGSTNLVPDAIENARNDIKCQLAEQDADGHWGNKIVGLQLSLRFSKSDFQANEPVYATIIYRNTRNDYLLRCYQVYGGDRDFGFLIRDENGNRLRDSSPSQDVSDISSVVWPPGTQYIYQSNLTDRFGLSNPGTYSIVVYRRLPNPDGKGDVVLYSTAATITISE